jgi:hypothetical protein
MDDFSTPVDRLPPINSDMPSSVDTRMDNPKPDINSVMDYNQLVQGIDNRPPQQPTQQIQQPPQQLSYAQQPEYINPPAMQSMKPHEYQYYQQPHDSPVKSTVTESSSSYNPNDIAFILLASLLIFSTSSQTFFMNQLPALFKEQKPSIVGSLIFSSILGASFVCYKSVSIGIKL